MRWISEMRAVPRRVKARRIERDMAFWRRSAILDRGR